MLPGASAGWPSSRCPQLAGPRRRRAARAARRRRRAVLARRRRLRDAAAEPVAAHLRLPRGLPRAGDRRRRRALRRDGGLGRARARAAEASGRSPASPAGASVATRGESRLAESSAPCPTRSTSPRASRRGHVLRTCLIGMALGRARGLGDDDRSAPLLRAPAQGRRAARATPRAPPRCSPPTTSAAKRALQAHATCDAPPARLPLGAARRRRATTGPSSAVQTARARWPAARACTASSSGCAASAAREIADGLGFPPATATAIHSLDEHWDGGGHPHGLRGRGRSRCWRASRAWRRPPRSSRRRAGRGGARRRPAARGRWFDPALVAAARRGAAPALPTDARRGRRGRRRTQPPERVLTADEARVSRVAHAFAEVIDAKSPSTGGHSHRVAALAGARGRAARAPADARELVRAALLHDIGKLGVSSRILDKPRPADRARVDGGARAPAQTEAALLARVAPLRPIAAVGGAITTSGSTAAATRAGCAATSCRSRRGCSPSPTSSRPHGGRPTAAVPRPRRWPGPPRRGRGPRRRLRRGARRFVAGRERLA